MANQGERPVAEVPPGEESQQQAPQQGLRRWWHNLNAATKWLSGLAALIVAFTGCLVAIKDLREAVFGLGENSAQPDSTPAVVTTTETACPGEGCQGQSPYAFGEICTKDALPTEGLIFTSEDKLVARVSVNYSPTCGTAWAELHVEDAVRHVILEMDYPGDSFETETQGNLVHTRMVRVAPGDCVEAVATVYFHDQSGHWPPETVSMCV